MAHADRRDGRKGRFDPLIAAVVALFLAAVGFAAVPAFNAGPSTLAGLMLLVGLAGVACLGFFALRQSGEEAVDLEPAASALVDALDEPAALAAADGRLHSVNPAWKAIFGDQPRLPKSGSSAANLFAALATARRGQTGHAPIRAHGPAPPCRSPPASSLRSRGRSPPKPGS